MSLIHYSIFLLSGMIGGVISCCPPGPINFYIIQQSLKAPLAAFISFIFGVIFAEMMLVVIAFYIDDYLDALYAYQKTLGYISVAVLLSIGIFIWFRSEKLPVIQQKEVPKRHSLQVLLGVSLVWLNLGLLFYWISLVSLLTRRFPIDNTVLTMSSFLLGVFIGAFLWYVGLSRLVALLSTSATMPIVRQVERVLSLLLIGFALYYGYYLYMLPGS